jgi:hypothetical protein
MWCPTPNGTGSGYACCGRRARHVSRTGSGGVRGNSGVRGNRGGRSKCGAEISQPRKFGDPYITEGDCSMDARRWRMR